MLHEEVVQIILLAGKNLKVRSNRSKVRVVPAMTISGCREFPVPVNVLTTSRHSVHSICFGNEIRVVIMIKQVFLPGWMIFLSSWYWAVGGLTAQEAATQSESEKRNLVSSALHAGDYDSAISGLQELVRAQPELLDYHLQLGDASFMSGRPQKAVASYDQAIEREPELKPRCWQRGLALYYAGQFQLGREQFESHQTWNRNDVENAVWHALCVAQIDGLEKAREQMIPITGDSRVPMSEIYQLFAGTGSIDNVLAAAAGTESIPQQTRRFQMYYAHFYIGLYHEMLGQPEQAIAAMKKAAEDNPIEKGRVMGAVADVHLLLRDAENRK